MIISRLNITLAVTLLIVMSLTAMSWVDYSRPNIEILPDMKYTPAWTSYAKNSIFRNQRTLQAPVPGTIARNEMPLHFEATKEDAVRAGEELRNPFTASPIDHPDAQRAGAGEAGIAARAELQQSILRGGESFRVFCVPCHGATGQGDGPVSQRGFPPPPSLLTGKSKQMKDGQLFHILTHGQGSMSGFAGQLKPGRRWDLTNYVRSLQPRADASTAAEAAEPKAAVPGSGQTQKAVEP